METLADDKTENIAAKTKRAASKASKARASSRPNRPAQPSLKKRAGALTRKAQDWAADASRLTAPLTDLSSNAMVIGALGLGIGVAIGAMLPRVAMPTMSKVASTLVKTPTKKRSRRK